ncbi:ATP synthase F0 subunit 6 (mitochondrion) [Ciona intestinalis B CG-2006]|uniref:ATP synthase subunit a n=1 Tax=Ciona intestinalis TaxID=7719 RepID=A7M7Z6_CIOIN|nr:ATP synthase F0 subunit 6 [Ciona intestinalis B CG-2006]CAL23349.2 ATPase subunit 6 [Ciona intestinalis]|eukprot:YP_006341026.1 ATP synthase F0 subunit 6 (mitochondrion) [Ciona intestinalis B CG-2006]
MMNLFFPFESSFMIFPMGLVLLLFGFMFIGGNFLSKGMFFLIMGQFTSKFSGMFFFYFSVFFVILFMNLLGMMPFGFSVSSLLVVTFSFSVMLWISTIIRGYSNNFKYNIAHLLPLGTPYALVLMLVWIEIMSQFARPLALGIRLMANITAGHLLLHLISQGFFFLGPMGILMMFLFSTLVILEIAVSFIQPYVFGLLLSLYMNEGLGTE